VHNISYMKGNKIMNKITWQGIAVGIIIGIVAYPQIRKIPVVKKLPTV
jgi:hypothetical protein